MNNLAAPIPPVLDRHSQSKPIVGQLTHDYSCPADHAVRLVQIAEILGRKWADVTAKQDEVNRLETLDRCNGRIYWRNDEIMYLNHGGGKHCPYCGSCQGKQRIRRYIGTDDTKQAAARDAMKNWHEWEAAKQTAASVRADYNAMTSRLNSVIMKQGRLW